MTLLRFVLVPLVAAVLLAPDAEAQIVVQVRLPTVRFEAAPPLVVVSPGVQVVEDYDDEVYYVNNYYWVRNDGRWYRTRDHRGGWVVVERNIPTRISRIEPGRYKRYKRVHVEPQPERRSHRKHHGKHRGHGKDKGRD